MSVNCTRCEGTGFLNADQFPNFVKDDINSRVLWLQFVKGILENAPRCQCDELIRSQRGKTWGELQSVCCLRCTMETDAQICDCCGNGEMWHDVPGEHYNEGDPQGDRGPYASNGGLCECH